MSPVSDLEGLENEFKEGFEQLAAAYKNSKLPSFAHSMTREGSLR